MRRGDLTWGVLTGPGFRRVEVDTYVASHVADSPELRLRALLVCGGTDAVATGWSACTALGLDVARRPMPVEITAPGQRLGRRRDAVVWQQRVPLDERTVCDDIATTTALRTAFDLARRSGPLRSAVDRVIDPLTEAVVAADALARLGRFTADDLTAFADRHRGARGVRRVATVAALIDPRSDSPQETRSRVKVVLAGLPRPVLQFEIRDALGMLRWKLDLAWPEFRVALEYDGHDHAGADRRGRDLDRLDALRGDGWIVIVITGPQLARPTWAPDRVRQALLDRGWIPGPDDWAGLRAENAELSRTAPIRGAS